MNLKEFANRLELSQTTVSRALSGYPEVKQATRERVLKDLAIGLGATYPMIVDPQGEIFTTFFGGAVVPTTYFIAPDGTVGNTIVGPMDLHILREQLRDLGVSVETLEES
jgi:hypothetical protein